MSDAAAETQNSSMTFADGAQGKEEKQIAPLPRISIQAFCETAEVASLIADAIADRRLTKTLAKIQMGGIPAAIEAFRDKPTPNLILLETCAQRETIFQQLESLSTFCDSDTKVVVIGHENDIDLYRTLLSHGISDYIVAPVSLLTFIEQLSLLYTGNKAQTLGRTICVVGAKGGVGTSTIAHNLAWSISRIYNLQSIIVDLDLAFGTAALDFNQDSIQGLAEAVFSPDRIDEIFVDRLLTKCSETLNILAAPVTLERTYDFTENAFDATIDILRATTPAIILDTPHQWTSWSRRVMMMADELIIVAAPDLANLRNAKSIIDTMKSLRRNDRPPRLMLNMCGVPRKPEIAISDFVKAIEIDKVLISPFDPKLFGAAANNGQMIEEIDPDCEIVKVLRDLGCEVMGRPAPENRTKILDQVLSWLAFKRIG